MEEILASQRQMLIRRGEPTDTVSDEKMTEVFQNHLEQVEEWISKQQNFEVIYIKYNDVLKNPADHIKQINKFLGNSLNETQMMSAIDKKLYRQKR